MQGIQFDWYDSWTTDSPQDLIWVCRIMWDVTMMPDAAA